MPTYSFVIPIHNEEDVLGHLAIALDELTRRLDGSSEFVFVDDGSTDGSWELLAGMARADRRCRLVRLSRNFGHQVAVTAGLRHATGDAVVIMDADLQDPPEVVEEMARRWREGHQVVYGLRIERDEDTWFKRTTAAGFYRVLGRLSSVDIPSQVGDFRLIDRVVVDAIGEMPERNRYVRGMFSWLGFSQIAVPYRRPARYAGTTSYSLTKMLRLAGDGVVGYSKTPLRAVLAAGVLTTAAGATGVAGSVVLSMSQRRTVATLGPSWRVLAAGVQLTAVGLVGEYIARVFDEALGRPLYVVRDLVDNSDDTAIAADEPSGEVHELFGPRDRINAAPAAAGTGPR